MAKAAQATIKGDTPAEQAGDSRWRDILLQLKNSGFEVYSPGVKVGDCLTPYIVVKVDGSTRRVGISTNESYYSILCYVPKQQYSHLEPFVQAVKQEMKKLEPMILPQGTQTPSFYDDGFNAHMVSIMYKNYKKML